MRIALFFAICGSMSLCTQLAPAQTSPIHVCIGDRKDLEKQCPGATNYACASIEDHIGNPDQFIIDSVCRRKVPNNCVNDRNCPGHIIDYSSWEGGECGYRSRGVVCVPPGAPVSSLDDPKSRAVKPGTYDVCLGDGSQAECPGSFALSCNFINRSITQTLPSNTVQSVCGVNGSGTFEDYRSYGGYKCGIRRAKVTCR
jgi:hypothetical protein